MVGVKVGVVGERQGVVRVKVDVVGVKVGVSRERQGLVLFPGK